MSVKTSRKERRAQRQRKERLRRIAAGLLVLGGIALIVTVGLVFGPRQLGSTASFDYGEEDINYDLPFTAVHEMNEGPPIPFLPKGDPQPGIAINETYYDFGKLGPSAVVTREFIIANTGEAPLTISRAYTTCGCTTAEFTTSVIPPGEVSVMTLIFDAGFHDVRGQTVRRGVIIENNDPQRSNAEIWVQASVLSNP